MKKTLIFSLFAMLSGGLFGQNWQTDFDTALALAGKENKHIILVFQGSDWCAPCIKLDHEIWASEEFITYATDHYIMLKADFPRSKKNALSPEQQEKNERLAEKYNKSGYFPYVVILDQQGTVLGSTGYKSMTPAEYIEHLNAFKS